ncbi:hypothetical protein P5704_024115 (plasmid) [Pseudomonas sp. FeN3W]|nr:hypothetical protein P5704_024115 [Pseudomonas sp. FeN3W]
MLKKFIILAFPMLFIAQMTQAENTIRIYAPIAKQAGKWIASEPLVSDWIRAEEPLYCAQGVPSSDQYDEGVLFEQTTSCEFELQRTVTPQQTNTLTHEVRVAGEASIEKMLTTENVKRSATGTYTGVNISLRIGSYYKSGRTYWGFMTPDFRSLYSIFVTAEGVPSENLYRGNEIKGIYFANDGTNAFVVAYKADENKITPIVVVDGQQCTLKAAYFNDVNHHGFHYTGCGASLRDRAGTEIQVKLK